MSYITPSELAAIGASSTPSAHDTVPALLVKLINATGQDHFLGSEDYALGPAEADNLGVLLEADIPARTANLVLVNTGAETLAVGESSIGAGGSSTLTLAEALAADYEAGATGTTLKVFFIA